MEILRRAMPESAPANPEDLFSILDENVESIAGGVSGSDRPRSCGGPRIPSRMVGTSCVPLLVHETGDGEWLAYAVGAILAGLQASRATGCREEPHRRRLEGLTLRRDP